jgi:membrane protein insertase Oxa1/YidC/SpoIIIJ
MRIICPLCRSITPIGKGVAYLATNNYVLHILATSNSTDIAILVSKCEEKDTQIRQLQNMNQLLEIKNQELEEKVKQQQQQQQQLQVPKLVLVIMCSRKKIWSFDIDQLCFRISLNIPGSL